MAKVVKKTIKSYLYEAHRMILEDGVPKSIGTYCVVFPKQNCKNEEVQEAFKAKFNDGYYLVYSVREIIKTYSMDLETFMKYSEVE